jgi:hypothetical protein
MKKYRVCKPAKSLAKQCVLVVALLLTVDAWSQINISMGIEAGVNCSGLPIINRWRSDGRTRAEKIMPVVRPLGGVWTKLKIRKHFYISAGLQYNSVGSRLKDEEHGYDRINGVKYTSLTREDLTFRKFSYPAIVGYDFNIRKLPASFYIGYRPIYYTRGEYRYRDDYSDEAELRDRSYEKRIDPFDHSSLEVAARRNQKQFLIGVGAGFLNNLYASFFCAAYDGTAFVERLPPGAWEATGHVHGYSRMDFVLSIQYTLLQTRKSKASLD